MNKRSERSGERLLDSLITAICADYGRRKEALEQCLVGRRVRMEYAYMNSRVFEGAGEISGGALAEIFIREIGEGIGYASSAVSVMSESTYKTYKKEIKRNIARKLKLID